LEALIEGVTINAIERFSKPPDEHPRIQRVGLMLADDALLRLLQSNSSLLAPAVVSVIENMVEVGMWVGCCDQAMQQ